MRDIRFRAWHKEEKKMYHWGSGVIWIDHQLNVYSLANRVFPAEVIELMQFTGLKDYNDKEIYEGDIVRCQYAEDRGPRFVDVVEWSNCEFKIGTYGLGEIEAEEIIGNIYEDPEIINIL